MPNRGRSSLTNPAARRSRWSGFRIDPRPKEDADFFHQSRSPPIRRSRTDVNAVSRFHRLNGGSFRLWAPPGRQYQIEYSTALLREVRLESAQADAAGLLYGRRENGTIRVVAARLASDATDPRLAGFEPIGIFASRARGEVFLTEADLERFKKIESAAAVALVVAGTRAGFFVHEPDGSLQSIKSHQEFSLDELPPQAPAPLTLAIATVRRKIGWRPLAAASAVLLSLLFGVWIANVKLRPSPPPALALKVKEFGGILQVSWNPRAISGAATLEIADGSQQRSVAANGLNGLSYAPRSGDVEFRLAGEAAHFLGADPPVPPLDRLRQQVAELDAEAHDLKTAAAIRNRRAAELERILSKMDLVH